MFVTGVNVHSIAPFSQTECGPKPTFSREENKCLATKQERFNTVFLNLCETAAR